MAAGASATVVDAFLASILNDVAFTLYGPVYVQLHTGAPGANGTANVAGESTREYAEQEKGAAGKTGEQARLALALMGAAGRRRKRYSHPTSHKD